MLAFTPQVQGALRWFDATHELTNVGSTVCWRRTGLPGAGSIGEQDARLMQALDVLKAEHQRIVATQMNRNTDRHDG